MSAFEAEIHKATALWCEIDLATKASNRVLLWGPPGTGKSFTGANTQGDLFRLYLTLDTPGSEIRGHYLPSESGGFTWHDGPATRAWRTGGRLVIDEIDAASGDTMTLLLGYLDDTASARMTLPSNETIVPHASFSCVATTNQLPTVIPGALLDRFEVVIHVTAPNPAAFNPQLWNSPDLCEAAKRVVYSRGDNKPKARGGRPIGLRNFRAIDKMLGRSDLGIEFAATLVLGPDAGRWLCEAMRIAKAA